MKTYNSIYKRLIVFCCFLSALVLSANAQWDVRNLNLVIDWQVNAPFSTGYADKISGWGMNYELKYEVNPRWDLGLVGIWEFLLHFIQTINMWKDRHCSFRLLKV